MIAVLRECNHFIEKGGIAINYDIQDVIIHCPGNILLQYVPGIKEGGSVKLLMEKFNYQI